MADLTMRICCCNALQSAAVNAGLQLLCSVIGFSSASLILSREHFWRFVELMLEVGNNGGNSMTTQIVPTTAITLLPHPTIYGYDFVMYSQQPHPMPPPLAPTSPPPLTLFPPSVSSMQYFVTCPPNINEVRFYSHALHPCSTSSHDFQNYQTAQEYEHQHPHSEHHPHYQFQQHIQSEYEIHSIHSQRNHQQHSQQHHHENDYYDTELRWIDAWIELSMTWYIGFAVVWISTLLGVCLSFRFYRPVLIMPNIVVLCAGLLFNGIAFGSLCAWVVSVHRHKTADSYEELIILYIMCSFLILFILNLAFIHISMHYYSFLEQKYTAAIQRIRPNGNSSGGIVIDNEDVEKNL